MTHTLRALAWLLRYPDAELRACAPQLVDAMRAEAALGTQRLAELAALAQRLHGAAGLRAEADYVETFDRGRSASLHLFEHVHGDSRDRGPAMVDLAQMYERAGLLLTPSELPDYLPVVLEFASTQPPAQAREFLRETAHIVRKVFSALVARGSLHAAVPAAVLELAGERAEAVEVPAEPALDDSWAEPAAFDGCSTQGQQRASDTQPIHIVRSRSATA